MAQFYASIQGNRGETTRMGTKSSGIEGHIRGWSVGIQIVGREIDEEDTFDVYLTSGSNGNKPGKHIGSFTKKDLD